MLFPDFQIIFHKVYFFARGDLLRLSDCETICHNIIITFSMISVIYCKMWGVEKHLATIDDAQKLYAIYLLVSACIFFI
jgi:hypothetical protein